MKARPVGQTSVDDRVRLVGSQPQGSHHLLDQVRDSGLVGEGDIGSLDSTASFDEDFLGSVDHDLADVAVFEKSLERAKAEDLGHDRTGQAGGGGGRKERRLVEYQAFHVGLECGLAIRCAHV